MFLKNYTSDVPVDRTIARIEAVLIRCGVSAIEKEYGPTGEPVSLIFRMRVANGTVARVRLPADASKAEAALWGNYVDGEALTADGKLPWNSKKRKKRRDFAEQAGRTAWRIVQDWVEVQLSMIQLGQAEVEQVFLPYIWDDRRKRSFYDAIRQDGYLALAPASEAPGKLTEHVI